MPKNTVLARSAVAWAAILLTACGGGGGDSTPSPVVSPPPPPPPGPDAVEAFTESIQGLTLDEFYRVSFAGLLTRSPESVVWQTLESSFPLDGVELDTLTEDYQRDTFDMHRIALDVLHTYDRSSLPPDEQLNYDVYEWYLEDVAGKADYFYFDFVATYGIFGVPRSTELFFTDIHPLATLVDAENYITRLNLVNRKFTELGNHVSQQRSVAGIVEPALTMQVAINQLTPLTQGPVNAHPYYTSFNTKINNGNLTATQMTDLRNRAQAAIRDSVIPGYQALLARLQSLISEAPNRIGVGQYTGGAQFYDYALRHHTTTDLSAAEIHQLGLDELARIHAEMRARFDLLGYPQSETLQQSFARVAADGGIVAARDSLQTFEDLVAFAEANLNQAFDVFPAAPVVVLPDPFGGFYIAPSFDGTRPGAFYAGTDFDQPFFQMPSLTFHESVPGHHLQIALGMEQDVPAFRKIERQTAFTEGWALYAERLAWELGWYDNDIYGDLGRLQYEALRAARLVMDTGIHSLGWTFEQAVQFNAQNVGWSRSASEGAAARYSVWPGQATAYMIGMLQILSERQRAMDALGANFDLIAFHRAILTNGSVPLALLDDVVTAYIADNL